MLQMIGIDHEKAGLDVRSIFSFQNEGQEKALEILSSKEGINGAVIISTCNRTEVYVSVSTKIDNMPDIVCELKGRTIEGFRDLFVERYEEEAVHHLFMLSCGMKSKIFGEDQIITQVKNALSTARDMEATDTYLESVFQNAITAAKKIKSQVHITAVKTSVVQNMIELLIREKGSLTGKKCLVIGNGEIGRLAATQLVSEGADVTVTVRNYKTRQVEIPVGCHVVDYKDRYINMREYDIIVSATASPHHTVKYEQCHEIFENERRYVFVDLAVPRDISSKFGEQENIELHDIDTLGGTAETERDNQAVAQAMQIIDEYEQRLKNDIDVKNFSKAIHNSSRLAGKLAYGRIEKNVSAIVSEEDKDRLENYIRLGTEKTVASILFDLKKVLPADEWKRCIRAVETNMQEKEWN